jgi:hypothetical protein
MEEKGVGVLIFKTPPNSKGKNKLVACPPITFRKLVVPFFEMPPNFFSFDS